MSEQLSSGTFVCIFPYLGTEHLQTRTLVLEVTLEFTDSPPPCANISCHITAPDFLLGFHSQPQEILLSYHLEKFALDDLSCILPCSDPPRKSMASRNFFLWLRNRKTSIQYTTHILCLQFCVNRCLCFYHSPARETVWVWTVGCKATAVQSMAWWSPGVCNCALGLQCDWWVQGGGEMEGNSPESLQPAGRIRNSLSLQGRGHLHQAKLKTPGL